MADTSQIREYMDVISSDRKTVGKVDHLEGTDKIKLTRQSSPDGEHHHFIPVSWVDRVDQHVHLNKSGADVTSHWQHGQKQSPARVAAYPDAGMIGQPRGGSMHPAANLPFERAVREFARWRAVPEQDRSPAPAWWWGPAFERHEARQPMPADWCARLELPEGSSLADGAAVLLGSLADQTSLPWPDDFPGKAKEPNPA